MKAPTPSDIPITTAYSHCETLASACQGVGFLAQINNGNGPHCSVRVTHAEISELSELIVCGQVGLDWFYLWSWGEQICGVNDAETAAQRIAYVLTPVGRDAGLDQ